MTESFVGSIITNMQKKCTQCNKTFEKTAYTSRKNWPKVKFCCQKCFGDSNKGKTGYWTGKKRNDPEYLRKISESHKGQHSSPETQFKKAKVTAHDIVGGKNTYRQLHKWVNKMLGTPNKCSKCGKFGHERQLHWANKSKKYKNDLTDWVRLCVKCHYEEDTNRQIKPIF